MKNHRQFTSVEHSNGSTYAVNGYAEPASWDVLRSASETMGIAVPASAPTLGGSGTGTIAGELYAFVRYMDRYGYVSNLSPISAVYRTNSLSGNITDATDAVPIVITSAAHGLTTGNTVFIDLLSGNTNANGSWLITVLTANTFSLDNSEGNGDYRGGGTWYRGVGTLAYTSVPLPTDTKVTRRQILRNKIGDLNTFYVDVEDTAIVATSFNSTKTDAQLGEAVPILASDGSDLNLT